MDASGSSLVRHRFSPHSVPDPMNDLITMILVGAIVGFTIWLSRISMQIRGALDDLGHSEEDILEIKEGIETLATVLTRLPDLMPQFNMNTNPLQPIFEAFAKKLSGEQPLITYEGTRDAEGRFHGTQKEETGNTPTRETND